MLEEKNAPSQRCGGCGSARAAPRLPGPPRIVACADCGLLRLAVFPSDEARKAAYQEDYYRPETAARFLGPLELVARAFRELRARAIARRGLPTTPSSAPPRVLDVGCGRGRMLHALRRRGWEVLGTQLSRPAQEAAQAAGVPVRLGELPALDLEPASFDAITLFHVLEHVTDPRRYLDTVHNLLRPGGLLVIEVPDHGSPGFRLLGVRHLCTDYPHHLYFFTRGTLSRLLHAAGFQVEAVRGFSLEYSPFTTLQNLLNALPGAPNRFYRALQGNPAGRALRRSGWTALHLALALLLAGPALLLSFAGALAPVGNTVRFYARRGAAT